MRPPTPRSPRPTFILSRWLFLRLLGAVFFIAFLSYGVQAGGLIGSGGLLPAADYLEQIHDRLGSDAYWRLPTILWWDASDGAIRALWIAGAVLSILLVVGVLERAVLALLWVAYLSAVTAGQTFFSFQWDVLLLETAFVSLWLAPLALKPGLGAGGPPSRWGLWLLRWLLFKLMFLSGATKLLSLDETWWGLTALPVHYESQPLPTWLGWYAFQLPGWFHTMSLWVMFVIELVVPFFVFGPRRLRHVAAVLLVVLQITIALTGNYTFFNLLSAALCVPLLDDRVLVGILARLTPRGAVRLRRKAWPRPLERRWAGARRTVGAVLAIAVLALSGLTFLEEMVRTERGSRARAKGGEEAKLPAFVADLSDVCEEHLLAPLEKHVLPSIAPFRTINGYGLFRVMTTKRYEIAIEGSLDGDEWREYVFRWKPGPVERAPGFVAPHQPRLDWQMWFAALNPRGHVHWLEPLMLRILEGSEDVLALLGADPFDGERPRYVRLRMDEYLFTTSEERAATGAWWRRESRGLLTAPISLPEEGRAGEGR